MNISGLTEKIARIESDAKRDRKININIADALFDASFNEHGRGEGNRFQKEKITDSELSLLSDIKHLGLTDSEEISTLAAKHGIDETRLSEMRDRYFVDLSQEERSALERLKLSPYRSQGSAVEESLEQKGFIQTLLPNEIKYLHEVSLLDLSKGRDIGLAMTRQKHGVSPELQEALEKTGILKIPSSADVTWLKAFEGGTSGEALKDLANKLEVKIWALKNRATINEKGVRKADTRAQVIHGETLVFDAPRVRWSREDEKAIDTRHLALVKPERKDLRLLTSSSDSQSTWQAVRRKRLCDTKAHDDNAFHGKLWALLSEMEKAALLARGDQDLSKSQCRFRDEHRKLFDESFVEQKRKDRLGNDEYFFLTSLRREPAEIESLTKDYGVSPSALKAAGYIDFLEESEKEIILKLIEEKDLTEDEEAKVDGLKGRGFIHAPRDEELKFLSYISAAKLKEKSELLKAADLFLLDEQKIQGLKSRGFISYLDDNERLYLEELSKDPKNADADLALKYDVQYPGRLKSRLLKDSVNLDIIVDEKPKFRLNPRVQYREERLLLSDRINQTSSNKPRLKAKDLALFVSDFEGENLSLGQIERLTELKSAQISLSDCRIPTNKELEFLRKIAWRTEDQAAIEKIAKADFAIEANVVHELQASGFLVSRDKKYLSYQESKTLTSARIWMNSTPAMRSKLDLREPNLDLTKALKGRTDKVSLREKLIDYEIYFKTLRGEDLTKKEAERLATMRENGFHPESREFSNWLKNEPKSWRMKDARKEAYLNHYEKSYGVNLPILAFVNTFKQATREQLLLQGLSEEDLKRYSEGIGPGGNHKLLNRHILLEKSGKPVTYYSIAHTGPISGRKFLEERLRISKSDISEKPQQRKDLLHHDLKVVDCVQKVIQMKASEGKVVDKLLNEAMQFARAKGGTQNHQRQGGPAFMDAEIIFREEITQAQSGGSKGEVIAVEYGNYTVDRMREKLQNCAFDQAYVFARPDYIEKYQKQILVANVTFLPMR